MNIVGGDWWMANQTLERALVFSGYEVNHAWGDGGHSTDHGTAIFADAMRWIWKDWPAPIKAGAGSPPLQEILLPGEPWKLVVDGLEECRLATAPADPNEERGRLRRCRQRKSRIASIATVISAAARSTSNRLAFSAQALWPRRPTLLSRRGRRPGTGGHSLWRRWSGSHDRSPYARARRSRVVRFMMARHLRSAQRFKPADVILRPSQPDLVHSVRNGVKKPLDVPT